MTVRLPSLDELARRWAEIEPLLRKATARGGGAYEPIDCLQLAMRGQMGIWIAEFDGAIAAAMTTEILVYPRQRLLEIKFVGGGRLGEWWQDFWREIDAHKAAAGCAYTIAYGRRGWAKFGMRPTSEIFVRD